MPNVLPAPLVTIWLFSITGEPAESRIARALDAADAPIRTVVPVNAGDEPTLWTVEMLAAPVVALITLSRTVAEGL